MPLLQTFHASQYKNPGSSPESSKTVVMKLRHNIIAFLKLCHNSVVWRNRIVGSKDSFLLESHYSRFTFKKAR